MNSEVILRDVNKDDLPIFFEQQLDKTSNLMAAFTAKDPTDKIAFMSHWQKILDDDRIIKKTVLFNGQVAGHVSSFEQFGEPEVSYWIGRDYWGRGVATRSLSQLLDYVNIRPLFARVVKDNTASIRVLEKSGFKICGEDKGYSNARTEGVEEYVLKLPSKAK